MKKEVFPIGQYILKYTTPPEFVEEFNKTFDNRKKLQLQTANKKLVGKIKDEFTLYDSHQDSEHTRCDHLSPESYKWFMSVFKDYLDTFSPYKVGINLSFVWVNEMKANEYYPVHYHSSPISFMGLSSVLILKLPKTRGKEYSPGTPGSPSTNGALEFIGNNMGQFSKISMMPNLAVGDMYIFPYDLRHTVYPFNGTNDKRRTLAANADTVPVSIQSRL